MIPTSIRRILLTSLTVLLLLLAPVATFAQSIALETDALAYPLSGYSAILRITHEGGFSYALGTGRYTLPTFLVKSQSTYDAAGWQATSEAIQVLRVGYRFFGPRQDGPAVDVIVLNQIWRLEAPRLGGVTHFKTLGAGLSVGYYVHLGKHFYAYPNAALTYDTAYAGRTSVQGRSYDVRPVGFAGSVHLGWEL